VCGTLHPCHSMSGEMLWKRLNSKTCFIHDGILHHHPEDHDLMLEWPWIKKTSLTMLMKKPCFLYNCIIQMTAAVSYALLLTVFIKCRYCADTVVAQSAQYLDDGLFICSQSTDCIMKLLCIKLGQWCHECYNHIFKFASKLTFKFLNQVLQN